MARITENTRDLVTNCIIRRLSTREALGYLKRCKVNVSERTYRRYKKEILKQRNMLEDYAWNNVQIEQLRKIETKKSIIHHCWDLFDKAEKVTEKLSLLKTIEKISDEFPNIVWRANTFGHDIELIEECRREEEKKRREDAENEKMAMELGVHISQAGESDNF